MSYWLPVVPRKMKIKPNYCNTFSTSGSK